MLNSINYNLGIPSLIKEWKAMFSPKHLGADFLAGSTVAFVAIPLSMAIALASGASPGAGIITSIVAGIVCALFGGTPLAVSGPTVAMAVLMGDTIEKFGFDGLMIVGLMAGLMHVFSGVMGFGKLARYVPVPVIAGFTAGIGAIIIINQLPRAFGLLPPQESNTIDVFIHLREYFHQANFGCFFIVVNTIILIRVLPKLMPKLPAILPAVTIASLIGYALGFANIPVIGEIPRTLPYPRLPSTIPGPLNEMFMSALAVFMLASLETLLSCSVLDKLTKGKKHDADQELIGLGLGNITAAVFSGIPVTSVIARSLTNLKAGAKTRRASVFHSLIILVTVFFLAPVISLIPIAALAGVLFSVAFSMINHKEFFGLWKTSRSEGLIYLITFITIIFTDLLVGIQAGIIAASIIILIKATKTQLHVSTSSYDNTIRVSITGSLTFLSAKEITNFEGHLNIAQSGQTVVLDLSQVTNLDSSGANAIIDLFNYCLSQKINFYIKGLPTRFEPLFKIWGGGKIIDHYYLFSETELKKKSLSTNGVSSYSRLVHGVQKFYAERKYYDRKLFDFMATKQEPHTLFITCSDSRIDPTLITSSEPGELFIMRNVGNYIPAHSHFIPCSEVAAIEFALGALNITDIVVCGHANCGAIRICAYPAVNHLSAQSQIWIDKMKEQLQISLDLPLDEIARLNVINQIKNLSSYPIVQERLQQNLLTIHGWFFEFNTNTISEWDPKTNVFTDISSGQFELPFKLKPLSIEDLEKTGS